MSQTDIKKVDVMSPEMREDWLIPLKIAKNHLNRVVEWVNLYCGGIDETTRENLKLPSLIEGIEALDKRIRAEEDRRLLFCDWEKNKATIQIDILGETGRNDFHIEMTTPDGRHGTISGTTDNLIETMAIAEEWFVGTGILKTGSESKTK